MDLHRAQASRPTWMFLTLKQVCLYLLMTHSICLVLPTIQVNILTLATNAFQTCLPIAHYVP